MIARKFLMVLAVGAIAAGVVPAQASGVSPAVKVTDDAEVLRSHIAPSLAANPADARHLVVVDVKRTGTTTATGTCMAYVSRDGGTTWSGSALPLPAGAACRKLPYPKVIFGPSGSVVAAYYVQPSPILSERVPTPLGTLTVAPGMPGAIVVARSEDGGSTFAPAGAPPQTPLEMVGGSVPLRIALTADLADRNDVYLAWTVGTPRWIWVSRSGDGGITFASPSVIGIPTSQGVAGRGTSLGPPAIAAAGGKVFVASFWYSGDGLADYNLWWIHPVFARSLDRGASFSETRTIAPMVAHYDFNGSHSPTPSIAVDPQNAERLYIVYEDERAGAPNKDAVLVRSTDEGATWSAPVRVGDDDADAGYPHDRPAVSVAPNGRVDVAWYDGRHDPMSVVARCLPAPAPCTGGRDVYYTYSLDGGASFAANVRVTATTFEAKTRRLGPGQVETLGAVGLISHASGARFVWEQSVEVTTETGSAATAWDLYGAGITL